MHFKGYNRFLEIELSPLVFSFYLFKVELTFEKKKSLEKFITFMFATPKSENGV